MWTATGESLLGPYDLAGATPITDSSRYSGRIVRARDTGGWKLLAFKHDPDGDDFGEITDPRPFDAGGGTLGGQPAPR